MGRCQETDSTAKAEGKDMRVRRVNTLTEIIGAMAQGGVVFTSAGTLTAHRVDSTGFQFYLEPTPMAAAFVEKPRWIRLPQSPESLIDFTAP